MKKLTLERQMSTEEISDFLKDVFEEFKTECEKQKLLEALQKTRPDLVDFFLSENMQETDKKIN